MLKSLKRFRLNLSGKSKAKTAKATLRDAIARALGNNVAFAAWSLPADNMIHFIANPSGSHGKGETTFAITPWLAETPVTIHDELDAATFLALYPAMESNDADSRMPTSSTRTKLPVSTSYMEYIDRVSDLIDSLKLDGGKCVISRIDSYSIPFFNVESMADAAMRAFEMYRDQMVYIFYTPETGGWLAATPELLLSVDKTTRQFSTLALAGTMHHCETPEWDDKNRSEQRMVSEYVTSTLSSLRLNFNAEELTTLRCGDNIHLATHFHGQLGDATISEIVSALHPTPAVAGWPVERALEQIAAIERHPRGCYGGVVTIDSPHASNSYVTLRCVQFDSTGYAFYGGGGITADSDPDTEWRETAMKIATIARTMR